MAEAFYCNVVITGDAAINDALRKLEPNIQRKLFRQVQRKHATNIKKLIAVRAPRRTGALAKNVTVRAAPKSRKFIGIDIGVGKKDYQGKQFYGAFLEFGTKKIPKGKYAFIAPTFAQIKENTKQAIMSDLVKGIADIVAETGGR